MNRPLLTFITLTVLGAGCGSSPKPAPPAEVVPLPSTETSRVAPVFYPPFRSDPDFLKQSASSRDRLVKANYEKAATPLSIGSVRFWAFVALALTALVGLGIWRARIRGFFVVSAWTLHFALTLVALAFLFIWPTLTTTLVATALSLSPLAFAFGKRRKDSEFETPLSSAPVKTGLTVRKKNTPNSSKSAPSA